LLSKYAMLFVGKKGPLENGFKVITMEFYSYLVLLSYYNQVKNDSAVGRTNGRRSYNGLLTHPLIMKRCRPGFSLESQCESEFETLLQDVYVLIYCQALCVIIVEDPMFVVHKTHARKQ
jgi:hypothetical protein